MLFLMLVQCTLFSTALLHGIYFMENKSSMPSAVGWLPSGLGYGVQKLCCVHPAPFAPFAHCCAPLSMASPMSLAL
uniref:Putative secreted protein n=1 Tax=Anopheles darlingi TaxID=43151 RepID=A0A2M4DC63_ANODA